jgi:hypothetical protein
MKITSKLIVAVALGGVLLVFFSVRPTVRGVEGAPPEAKSAPEQKPAEGRKDIPLKEFMRAKLQSSNKVLEGLVTDDPALVKEGAEALHSMSNTERWRVSNDAMYRQFSGEFRRITEQLVDAADKKNMDQAALRWVDATMSCIECHHYVRGIMIADSPAVK